MTKTSKQSAPVCALCARTGAGVTFAMFTPRILPFGTVCTECEAGPEMAGFFGRVEPGPDDTVRLTYSLKDPKTGEVLASGQAGNATAAGAIRWALSELRAVVRFDRRAW